MPGSSAPALCLLTLCALGCGATAPPAEDGSELEAAASPSTASTVRWYTGTAVTTSPDGQTPYGPPVPVLVRRTLRPSEGVIEEYVINGDEAFPTTLERVDETAVFRATDEAGTFSGTLTFSGPEWEWTGWSYDLTMSDGSGALRGTAVLTEDTLDTEKMFHGPDGNPQAKITEHLTRIEEARFEELRGELLAAPRNEDEPESAEAL